MASFDAKSAPIFPQFARGHPLGCDDVRPLPAVDPSGRRSSARAWHQYQLLNRSVLVEPVRPMFAWEIKKHRVDRQSFSNWRWRLDEVFVRINAETHYLWRAVNQEGETLEVFVTERRNRKAALNFLKRAVKHYGEPKRIVTDRLRSHRAAMRGISNAARQECGGHLNNHAENSHQPFRRREKAMVKFTDTGTPRNLPPSIPRPTTFSTRGAT